MSTNLDISVVQSLGVFVELNPYCECVLIVPEGAQCFKVKVISILGHHFGLRQGDGNFPCSEINIYTGQKQRDLVIDFSEQP